MAEPPSGPGAPGARDRRAAQARPEAAGPNAPDRAASINAADEPPPTSLLRELKLSYLPPLMVYLAAGVAGLTNIVGTFFVKDYLGLSAAFIATLGFWAGIPWALKMPVGHLVDLFWRYKAGFVYLGAALLATSLGIMAALIGTPDTMRAWWPVANWFVLASLLSPIGYVLQDAVADAMTVEAIPRVHADGSPTTPAERKRMNTTMQTLGRVAIIGGSLLVAVVNIVMFDGTDALPAEAKAEVYVQVYLLALVIPLISVAGVIFAAILKRRRRARDPAVDEAPGGEVARPNWWILGGGLVFVLMSVGLGTSGLPFGEEAIFIGSMLVIGTMMWRLMKELEPDARTALLGTAIIIFVFRALPGPGPGVTWWEIDALGFDGQFLAQLSLIASALTLLGLFAFRRMMADRSISWIVGFLTIAGFVLGLPIVGMYYGLHEWTAAMTGGIVDARFIAMIDTAVESPLGQISMVPMLAWIANSAPRHLKATFFAVMASFTNLALSASQLGTKYLNQAYEVTRQVVDPATGTVVTPADYSQLGELLIVTTVLGLVLPFAAIAINRLLRLNSA